jgi:hypothetical protein
MWYIEVAHSDYFVRLVSGPFHFFVIHLREIPVCCGTSQNNRMCWGLFTGISVIDEIGNDHRIQDTGYKIQDTRYRIQDTGYREVNGRAYPVDLLRIL